MWNIVFLPVSPEVVDPDDHIGSASIVWPMNLAPTIGAPPSTPFHMDIDNEATSYTVEGNLELFVVNRPIQGKTP